MSRSQAVTIAVAVLLLFLGSFLLFSRSSLWEVFQDVEAFRLHILDLGWKGPLAFVALQFLQVVIFPIPGSPPQIAGGYLYGVLGGTVLSLAGIMAGSTVNFLLARLLGFRFVQAIVSAKRTKRFESALVSEKAPAIFFLMFLFPGFPKDALCYIAGLSALSFKTFLLVGTAGRLVYVYLVFWPGCIGIKSCSGFQVGVQPK